MKKRDRFLLITLITLYAGLPYSANAATDEIGFNASSDIAIIKDNNIYRVVESLAQSDKYLRVSPEINLSSAYGKHRFSLIYNGDYAKFSSYDEANFDDHEIEATAILDHSQKLNSFYTAKYTSDHEEPGSLNRVQLGLTEYNKFDQKIFLAGLSYGTDESIGKITGNYQLSNKEYQEIELNYLNFDSQRLLLRFDYRLAAKTRAYISSIYSDYDYYPSPYELDNKFLQLKAGIIWDISNKLTGDINLGYQERNYRLEQLRDISGLAYDGNIEWAISSYTLFTVGATRQSIDSSIEQSGGFLRTSYSFSLSHEINKRFKIKADFGTAKDNLVSFQDREDKRDAYNLKLIYEFNQYLNVEPYFLFESRKSTEELAEFEAKVIGINLQFLLED